MIERIPDQIPVQTGEWRGTTFDIIPFETFAMACRKINELVDTVNKQEQVIKTLIDGLERFAKSQQEVNMEITAMITKGGAMIEKLPEIQIHSCAKINEKLNEVIDWINDVSAFRVTDKQVTANLPNIDAGELAFLSKENSDLKDELERTRKALDCAINTLDTVYGMSEDDGNIETYIKCKRIEITALTKGGDNE